MRSRGAAALAAAILAMTMAASDASAERVVQELASAGIESGTTVCTVNTYRPCETVLTRDGSHVFFAGGAYNAFGRSGLWDHVVGGATTLVSPDVGGIFACGQFRRCRFLASENGDRVVFESQAPLLPDDADSCNDIEGYDGCIDVYERAHGETRRLSMGLGGSNGRFNVNLGGVSADASRVFFSTAEALTPDDTDSCPPFQNRPPGCWDVYEHNAGGTTLVSKETARDAYFVGSSEDGQHVFFSSTERLSSADTDDAGDIYERFDGKTSLVTGSVSDSPPPQYPEFYFGGISADGSHVFFGTNESLVSEDTNGVLDVYERSNGKTKLVSEGADGALFEGASRDGRHVFFLTRSSLDSADTDAREDVYERFDGTTTLISTGPRDHDLPAAGTGAFFDGSSEDGNRVFFSTRDPLVDDDTDAESDIYERKGTSTRLISTGPAGGAPDAPASFDGASADGRHVYFSTTEALVMSDTDSCRFFDTPEGGCRDIYERFNRRTTLISAARGAVDPNCYHLIDGAECSRFIGVSARGTRVAFATSDPLVAADMDGLNDIYVASLTGPR